MAELHDTNPALLRQAADATGEYPDLVRNEKYPLEKHSSSLDEKHHVDPEQHVVDAAQYDAEMEHYNPGDPFPVDPSAPVEDHQLTVRAIIVGCALGAVVGASNIYLGLKTGFTFGPQLFGAILGFAIIKPLSQMVTSTRMPGWLWGGPFGPKENVCVQTAATSAGGLGIIFVGGIPAMYRLNLMSYSPADDRGKLFALAISCAYFGCAFAIPLRKYFIIKQRLVFPTPTATAFTIRSLHSGKTGAIAARKKAWCLFLTLILALGFKVANGYAPGMLLDWHIGWTLYQIGWTSIIALENYGWFIEFTPAFFGAGMVSGLNASWSFLAGAVLGWGIISPSLIHTGKAVSVSISDDYPLLSMQALKFKSPDDYIHAPSPRYWLLWPGVLIMLVYSFIELFMSIGNMVGKAGGIKAVYRSYTEGWTRRNDPTYVAPEFVDDDPSLPEDRVPWWAWSGILAISVLLCLTLVSTQFDINVGEIILALILGFIFSFIAVQSSGDTDINPVSTVAKASQLIYGGIGKGQHLSTVPAERLNLIAGVVAGGAAAQGGDMTGDLKTGHLIGAKPKVQFVAQLCGATVASFLTVGLFVLFAKASPCILYPPPDGQCTYGAPSISAWAAVAQAVAAPKLPIPPSSGYTAIGLSIAAGLNVVVKHLWVPKKYWHWMPNWNAIGLAFVVPQTYYPIAMAFGSTFMYFWEKKNPAQFDMYAFPLAAGLLAGEGLGGVVQALLQVAGVGADGIVRGTSVGCPGFEFCG